MRDRSVNAFALPGGYVGVHLGLIAHDHGARPAGFGAGARAVARHAAAHRAQHRAAAAGLDWWRWRRMMLGVIAASRASNADMANAAIMGGQAAAIQGQLNFSRDMEREADRIGYGVLAAAGFSTAGMGAMFEKMDVATRLNDNGSFPYLRSHPLTVDRISEARNRALLGQQRAAGAAAAARADADARPRADGRQRAGACSGWAARPRRRVLVRPRGGAVRRRHGRFAAGRPRARRGAGRRRAAAGRHGHAARAGGRSARCTCCRPRCGWRAATPPGALAALDALPAGSSTPRAAAAARAGGAGPASTAGGSRTGAAAVDLRRSTEALQTWLADQPQDAAAWELLAGTSEALGLRLRSMRAGAEARAVVGDLSGAIDRLRAAQAVARTPAGQDFIEASVIDARLRQLMAQRRQMALEARGGRAGPPAPGSPRRTRAAVGAPVSRAASAGQNAGPGGTRHARRAATGAGSGAGLALAGLGWPAWPARRWRRAWPASRRWAKWPRCARWWCASTKPWCRPATRGCRAPFTLSCKGATPPGDGALDQRPRLGLRPAPGAGRRQPLHAAGRARRSSRWAARSTAPPSSASPPARRWWCRCSPIRARASRKTSISCCA